MSKQPDWKEVRSAIAKGSCRLMDVTRAPAEGGWYVLMAVKIGGPDPRRDHALKVIERAFPKLGRRKLGITSGEGYRQALTLMIKAGVIYPPQNGERAVYPKSMTIGEWRERVRKQVVVESRKILEP